MSRTTPVDFRNRGDRVPTPPAVFRPGLARARPTCFAPRVEGAGELEWFHDNRGKLRSLRFVTTFTPTAPTFTTPISATSYATSTTPGTTVTLDLTTKFGAWLHCRIGRNAATALTRAAYIAIRRQINNTLIHPANSYDFISSTAAVNATTVSSGGASGATTMVLASGTGFAAGQICCAQLAGARCEWFEIDDLTTATITVDRSGGFRTTHNASDVVTNGADVGSIWLPGGDIWEITPVNNSGQTVVMAVDAAVYASDTGT